MNHKNNVREELAYKCRLLNKKVFRILQNRNFRSIFYLIANSAILFTANTIPSHAEDQREYIADFFAKNPKIEHKQFYGKEVNVLYSCTTGRSSSSFDMCHEISNDIANIYTIKFIQYKTENPVAINFLVTDRTYPNSIVNYFFKGCGKSISGQTVIYVNSYIDKKSINLCIKISTLSHLGFNVSNLYPSTDNGTDIDIDKILSFYVK